MTHTVADLVAEAIHPEWCSLCPTDPTSETAAYSLQLSVRALHDGRWLTRGDLLRLADHFPLLPEPQRDQFRAYVLKHCPPELLAEAKQS